MYVKPMRTDGAMLVLYDRVLDVRGTRKHMLNDFGSGEVTVKKDELLGAMTRNRETHREKFLAAQDGYRRAAIDVLDAQLKRARGGVDFDLHAVQLVAPEDHTIDYDRVIAMLKMSIADEIKVSEAQFSQYVLDEWRWSRQFQTVSASYGVR